MLTEIGIVAGEIWRLLDKRGRLEFSELVKSISQGEDLALMALGWLCREGHVLITEENRKIFVALRPAR